MYETYFMGKHINYWIKLEALCNGIEDDPELELLCLQLQLRKLDTKYVKERKVLADRVTKLGINLGK
jgi:hypothetical protein